MISRLAALAPACLAAFLMLAPPAQAAPTPSVNSVSVAEGNSATTAAVFTVTLSEAPTEPQTLDFETADERATGGVDYVSRSGTIDFAAGQQSRQVAVTVNGDTTFENDERFALRVSDPESSGEDGPAQGFATILNDEVALVPGDADILFGRTADGTQQAFAMNPQGGNQTQLTSLLEGAEQVAASPARDRIAFVSYEGGDAEIFVAKTNGTGVTQVTHNEDAFDEAPAWSPDGQLLAFEQQRSDGTEIHTIRPDGTGETNISFDDSAADFHPSFSPDGVFIAFQRGFAITSSQIWAMTRTGANRALIADNQPVLREPVYSPDGGRIAYSAGPTNQSGQAKSDIYTVRLDPGATPQQVTSGPEDDRRPAWAPGGSTLLFDRKPVGSNDADIHSVGASGGTPVNLTQTPFENETEASWGIGAPICQGSHVQVGDDPVRVPLSCTDVDGHAFTLSITRQPEQGSLSDLDQAGAAVTYVPKPGFSGTDTFRFRATDGEGASNVATVSLSVTSSLPPQNADTPVTQGDAPKPSGDPGCVSRVLVGKWVAVASCFKPVGNDWSSQGKTVRLNGIDLHARGGDFVVDPTNKNLRFVGKGSDEASVALGGSVIYTDPALAIDLTDDRLSLRGLKAFLAFQIPGVATLQITARPGGEATLTLPVDLPAPLDKVTGHMQLRTSMENGPYYIELKLAESPIGPFVIKDLHVLYHFVEDRFVGTGRFILPTPRPYDAAARIEFVNGRLVDLSASIGNLNVPVGQAVYLQRLRFAMKTNPLFFSGGAGFSAGPSIEGKEIVSIDGDVSYKFSTPGVFRVDGVVKIASPPLSAITGFFQYTTNGILTFGAKLDWVLIPDLDLPLVGKVRGVGMRGSIDGFVEPGLFQAYGQAEVYASVFSYGGEAVISSAGAAACGGWQFDVPLVGRIQLRVGMGYGFRTRQLSVMAPTCDVGPWIVRNVGAAQAVAIAPGSDTSYRTVADSPSAAFAFVGKDRPPDITVSGPGAVSTSTTADLKQVKTDRMLIWQTPHDKTTYVFVAGPGAGPWNIAVAPTSSPVSEVRQAEGLPKPSIRARVDGRGHRRVLRYSLKAIPGQKVTFAELGANGSAKRLGVARGTSGRLRFAPVDGPAGRRRIVAQVTQGGMPRTQLTVARYRAPGPRLPGRPGKVALRRRGKALEVRWLRGARATRYEVRARIGDGREILVLRKGQALRIAGVGSQAARVSVVALDGAGRRSRARTKAIGKWPKPPKN